MRTASDRPASPVELSFASSGVRCGATLVQSSSDALNGARGRPCVVMAHGFGCTRDSGLLPFAEQFAAAGTDVLLFDYRCFGTSDGEPRQYVSHWRQRQDWQAAVAHARTIDGVDPTRIALWGTSYSGGHVITVAAKDPQIAAVISQGAAVDGLAILRKPEKADPSADRKGPRMVVAALRDVGRGLTRRRPVTVPAVGAPGDFAMLTDATSYCDYLEMMGPTWRNEVCARSLLLVPVNRPVLRAGRVRCPTLLVIAERDTIAPASAVREVARRIGPRAETVSFDCAHFDIYRGSIFAESVAAQVEFLTRSLRRCGNDFQIPDALDARLRHEAERRGITIADISREALEAYLGDHRRGAGWARPAPGTVAAATSRSGSRRSCPPRSPASRDRRRRRAAVRLRRCR